MIRLDKFLSEMGAGTRQEVKQYIRKGRVEVDGEIAKRPELKVDETKAHVTLDGERIGYASYVYYMLNKPAGVVSATEDKREKTVIDLIEGQKRKDLFPVGRLDKDTVGLLLITNDGNLAHRLLSPIPGIASVPLVNALLLTVSMAGLKRLCTRFSPTTPARIVFIVHTSTV